MALSRTSRGSASGTGSSRSLTAFTPANGSLLVAIVGGIHNNSGNTVTGSGVTGGGLTWTRQAGISATDLAFSPVHTFVTIWTAPVTTGSSTTVASTNSVANPHGSWLACFEYSGQDASPIGATATGGRQNASGSASITLSGTPATDSEVIAGAGANNWVTADVIQTGTGWTGLVDINDYGTFTEDHGHVQIRTGSTSTTVGWNQLHADPEGASDASGTGAMAALEIKAAGGGGSVSGTFGVTVDAVTQSASADLLVQGSLSQTIAAVTQSASADLLIQGTFAQTIDAVTLSANGSSTATTNGTFNQTIEPVTQSASGDLLVQGQFSQTIDAVTQSASADLIVQGGLAQTISPVTQSATGAVVIQGTFGQTIQPVTLDAAGLADLGEVNGAVTATLDNVTLFATARGPNRDTGGSGNRNINDDPDAFAEMLQEWRERKKAPEYKEAPKPVIAKPIRLVEPEEPLTAVDTGAFERVQRLEASLDRSIEAYHAAKERVKVAKEAKLVATKAKEDQARQKAIEIAAEWERARLAYEAFLDEDDEFILMIA